MMDPKTLEALKGSIAKWEAIVAGTGEDQLSANCPLCHLFTIVDCIGCPVKKATKRAGCVNTPFSEWYDTFSRGERRFANTPARIRLAQAELDFLRSLLPAEESK